VSSPEESSVQVLIISFESALGNGSNVIIGLITGVGWAFTLLDTNISWFMSTEWTKDISGSVEVNSDSVWKVRSWAVNPVAGVLWDSIGIVETSEPGSANISSERPFSEPDFILPVASSSGLILVTLAEGIGSSDFPSGFIEVMVNSYFVDVIIVEKVIPSSRIVVESIMEDEMSLRSILLDERSYLSVEVLQLIEIGGPPWLVDWLIGGESWVRTPSLEKCLSLRDREIDVISINLIVFLSIDVPRSLPSSSRVGPVTEVGFIGPSELESLTGGVKTILGTFMGMKPTSVTGPTLLLDGKDLGTSILKNTMRLIEITSISLSLRLRHFSKDGVLTQLSPPMSQSTSHGGPPISMS
jgi:hypothetical protein